MTKALCWRVHIASLVEHIFVKRSLRAQPRTPSCHSVSWFSSFFPLLQVLLCYPLLLRTCCCVGFRYLDFYPLTCAFFVSWEDFLFLILDISQGSILVLLSKETSFKISNPKNILLGFKYSESWWKIPCIYANNHFSRKRSCDIPKFQELLL